MKPEPRDIIRRCVFRPYRKGMGPTFTLTVWDTYQRHRFGQSLLGYCLTMREDGKSAVLFEGEDYGCSPLHAIDSNSAVEGLMSFLTLRPGDTDAEYFADYTPLQREYCEQHAEALGCEVDRRFCDASGRVIERN